MRPLSLVVCLLLVSAVPSAAQIISGSGAPPNPRGVPTMQLDTDLGPNRQPTFRAVVTRVQVSVRVTGRDGQPVRGLQASDFAVFEEGQPQEVVSFNAYTFDPASMPLDDVLPTGPVTSTTATMTNAYADQARVFALIIDDLHIHPRRTERARAIGREFVNRLHPSDLLLVSTTSGRMASFTFSRDRVRALEAIEAAYGQRLPDPTSEMLQSPGRHTDGGLGGYNTPGLRASQQQRVMQLEMAYESITRAAAAAMGLQGRRKTLLYVSEGSPIGSTVNASGQVAGSGSANVALQNAMAAATVADMVLYTVTPTGLDIPGEFLIETNGRHQDGTGREILHEDLASVIAEFMQTKTQLRDMASLTGGLALIDTNDASRALTRVLDEASEYYVLSYEPDKPARNDKFRSVKVEVARPDVRVAVRRGYMAPQGMPPGDVRLPRGLTPQLRALLTDAVPHDGLHMRAQAIPLSRDARGVTRVAVMAEVGGARLAAQAADGPLGLTLAMLTLDDKGTASNATRKDLKMTLTAPQAELLGASALRVVWAVELPKGAHQVRLAVTENTSTLGGSLYLDVDIPATGLTPGIALGSRAWTGMPTAFIDPAASAVLQVPPTAIRVFPGSDVLQVTVTGLSAATSIAARDANGTVVWEEPLPMGPELRQLDLPLGALEPGQHRLVVGEGPNAPGLDFVVLPQP